MAERPVQLRKHVTHTNRMKIIGDASGKQEEINKMEAHSQQTDLNYKARNKTEMKVADQTLQIFPSKKLKSWFCQTVGALCPRQTSRPGLRRFKG